MSVFACAECGCVENTATCRYWQRLVHEQPPLCSQCDPDIGRWHGYFPREPWADVYPDTDPPVHSPA